jgi:hypothetical protein
MGRPVRTSASCIFRKASGYSAGLYTSRALHQSYLNSRRPTLRNSPRLAAHDHSCLRTAAAGLSSGRVFRCVCRAGRHWGEGVIERLVWHVVKTVCSQRRLHRACPHDLRRSCAKLCHSVGGELEQVQFLPGHVCVQTTERYLGCKQRIRGAVNDHIGIEP